MHATLTGLQLTNISASAHKH